MWPFPIMYSKKEDPKPIEPGLPTLTSQQADDLDRIQNATDDGRLIAIPPPMPATPVCFPSYYIHRLHDRRDENERDFNGAAAWKIEEVGEGFTVVVSRDFEDRLVIVRKTKLVFWE